MRFVGLKRREFITLLGGTAVAWPLGAHAQQPAMPVIGFLSTRSQQEAAHLVRAFHRGLSENGFVDGQNLTVDFRWADGRYDRLPALAAELVRRLVKVIAATGGEPAPLAAKAATATIPIVFAVGGDPVRSGLVASYGQPGGNITGVSILTRTMEAKRIGLLREVVPGATTIGFLMNPTFPAAETQLGDIQEAVRSHGIHLEILRASTDQAIDAAFETIARQRIPALVIGADPFFDTRRTKLAILAAKQAVPTMFHLREYAEAGGLMSYGIDLPDVYRQVGDYAGRILKGAKPADLPVLQPTKFELVINLQTAKALGVDISPNLHSLADEVIE
jgi:putative tryptophan/tyrosine transport system substrate-binding protein